VDDDLRWGVYVTFAAPSDYVAGCFAAYGLATDRTGRYAALWRPYHLIGLETTVSVLAAGLLGEPTGSPTALRADAVAVAKRDLGAGETLDGEGGFTVYGTLLPASRSLAEQLLPVGLARGAVLRRAVPAGRPVGRDDVRPPAPSEALALRSELESAAVRVP
jgi:predicted homoserine dehydrogenase-like protein